MKNTLLALGLLFNLNPLQAFAEHIGSPKSEVERWFKINEDSPEIRCDKMLSITVKQDTKNTKDYLVICSNKKNYRIVKEHMSMWMGRPADKWKTSGFKCWDLKSSTIKGWQDPKDWNITNENCATN